MNISTVFARAMHDSIAISIIVALIITAIRDVVSVTVLQIIMGASKNTTTTEAIRPLAICAFRDPEKIYTYASRDAIFEGRWLG